MSVDLASASISNRLVQLFIQAAREELGDADFQLVLSPAHLEQAALEKEALVRLDGPRAAEIYAGLQQALRTLLLRIGRRIWERRVLPATFREKAGLEVARRLPVPTR